MNLSNLLAPQVSATSATSATSCTPPTPTPSSPSPPSSDLLHQHRHQCHRHHHHQCHTRSHPTHMRQSLGQDSCNYPYHAPDLPPNHPSETASSVQIGSDRSGTQRSQDDHTQPLQKPVLIHMGSLRRDGSENHPGYIPHERHSRSQHYSRDMEGLDSVASSSEGGDSHESRRPAVGYQRFRHPEDGCYFEQHSPSVSPAYLQQESLQEQSDPSSSLSRRAASPLNHVDTGFGSRVAVPFEQHSDYGRDSLVAQADCNSRSIGATWPLSSKSNLDCHGKDNGDVIASAATALHSVDSRPSSSAAESPPLTSTPLPLPSATTSTAGALWLSASNVPWNRSSLRNEISSDSPPTPASAPAFPSPTSTVHAPTNRSNVIHSASSSRHSARPTSPTPAPSSKTAAVRAPYPSNPTKLSSLASSPLRYPSSPPTNSLTESAKKPAVPAVPAVPASAPSSPTQSSESGSQCFESRGHDAGGGSFASTFDQQVQADTRSTFASDTGQRRGSTRSVLKTEGDQEVPRPAGAGAARQGEHSGIMGAGAYHASVTAAVTAATGGEGEGGGRDEAAAGAASAGSRYPLATTSTSKNPHQHRHFEPHCTSSPPPASQFRQEYPRQHEQQQQQQAHHSHQREASSEGSRRITAEGTSASSLFSSTVPQPFATGTPDAAALTHRPSSPSMNNHPLNFDQTGQRPYHHHHPFHGDSNSPSGFGDPALSNKRRSLADLLFVPTKNMKTKEKRNSGGASSVSSVESYRQEEGNMEHHFGWPAHPKSASGASTSSNSSASAPAQRLPSESQQASPPPRKASTAKGVNRGAGGATSTPKTFQCTGYPGCNMVFTRSEHLARHERKHTGEKPYKCIVANCPRTFSRYDNMIQHTQTHGDRSKRDSLAAVAAVGNASRSRSSSLHSTPLLTGRPRGGSSPVVFGPGYEDAHHRSLESSPASTSYMAGSPFSQHQHRHAYTPQQHQQQQQYQHPMQWNFPSGAPASSSPSLSTSRSGSGSGSGIVYNGDTVHFQPESNPSTTVVRTLKANSRSLPHLQPRSSLGAPADSPSIGLQQDMSNMEIEELKRRKSEVLLPSSSYSGGKVVASGYKYIQGQGQAIGLGMSPFAASSTHPSQPLPHVEKLTPQEQESLHEHRRSAQAMLSTVRAGFGPTERRATPESSGRSSLSTPGLATEGAIHNRSGSLSQALPFRHDLSFVEKNRLLEHRNSTPDLIYDAMRAKRSSNDPTDMNIQPLPSRDSRSGVQWFSQVSTPTLKSEPPMTPRDIQVGVAPLAPVAAHRSSGIDSAAILPPIVRSFSESEDDRRPRPRSHSSHIHPLSRPSSQSFGVVASSAWTSSGEATDRLQFDSTLSPTLERRLEEWYYPIRKKEVQDAIEQMETREFLGLKTQVAKSYANEQFRNPEFLGNMTSILCVIRAPHPSWKNTNTDIRQASEASNRRSIGGGVARPRQSRKGMDVDDVGGDSSDDQASNSNNDMDVDEQDSQEPSLTDPTLNIERPCRYALDIDMDPLGRDPEPDLRAIEGLTINSLFPTKSFVTGFEPAMVSTEDTAAEEEACPKSLGGYPSNARIGRFYLPERAFRTPESLNIHPNPNGPWVCCRFKEYRGVSIWVLESVLESYHELAQRHKMALTLQGVPMYHRTAMYDHDEWEIRAGEQCDVKVKETVLYPEMIQQVWKDMHQSYVHQHQLRQQPQQQLQQQYKQRPEGHSHQLPPHLANRVSTYEEYQKSLWQADPRRESYPNPHPRPSTDPYGDRRHYDEYRQYPQSLLHREDLSSAPSSPNSPRMDDFQEDNHDSVSSTLGRHQDMPSSTVGGFTNLNLNSANMHRRISIAELCNPMQSLATERGQSSK